MKMLCPDSPAPFSDAETLVRGIYSPDLYRNGRVQEDAMKLDDLMSKKGLVNICGGSSGVSVFRIDHAGGQQQSDDAIGVIVNRPLQNGILRQAVGVSTFSKITVEHISDGRMEVLDDGGSSNHCHAVIRAKEGETRSSLREARNKFIELLNANIRKFV